jgi:hypothetical protein
MLFSLTASLFLRPNQGKQNGQSPNSSSQHIVTAVLLTQIVFYNLRPLPSKTIDGLSFILGNIFKHSSFRF